MTLAQIVVTLVGIAAIGWVLWYFLALPAPPSTRRRAGS
jgi:hypothetical protein